MLTSLALSVSGGSQRPILACGMESGSVIFHDFSGSASSKTQYNLTKDPILAMDLVPSDINSTKTSADVSSVLALAGMAGDASEVGELPKSDQGRVAVLKATHDSVLVDWNVRMRARIATCSVDEMSYGKPGVSICRFRPGDGRLFAVGGWDHRVRLFERTTGTLMGILRGHSGSVNALDWAPDAKTSGLLASSAGDDNRIYLWQCFAKG
jgi:WD40 repeat protein